MNKPVSWKYVFHTNNKTFDWDPASIVDAAKTSDYPYFLWGGKVYAVPSSGNQDPLSTPTNLTAEWLDKQEVEVCVMCQKTTGVKIETPVENRKHYVSEIGQLCKECDEKTSNWEGEIFPS